MSNISTSHAQRRKLLYIVTWNIGGLDFMVAVLWKLRTQYPNVDITVFFAEPHYDHVLRGGRFFLELFNSLGIEYKDFRDLLPTSTQSLLKVVEPILAMSPLDHTTPKWIQRLQHFFNRRILHEENFLSFVGDINPDCIIIEDRKYYKYPFCGFKRLAEYYHTSLQLTVVQIPHATNTEYYGNVFRDERDCEIWLSLVIQDKSKNAIESLSNVYQTFVPSLDDEWIEVAKSKTLMGTKQTNCVVLLEAFDRIRDRQKTSMNHNKRFTFQQMKDYLSILGHIQKSATYNIHFIIKPHPKQDAKMLTQVLLDAQISNYSIIWESTHTLLSADICISMLTTAVYPFIIARIPTLLVVTHRISLWQLPDVFTNLTYACHTPEEIMNALNEILSTGHRDIERDYQHIRSYLPDHALDTVMSRLRLHLRLEDPQEV